MIQPQGGICNDIKRGYRIIFGECLPAWINLTCTHYNLVLLGGGVFHLIFVVGVILFFARTATTIIVMGLLTQTNLIKLPQSLYSWSVIFIIPINSALNPFLFTFMVYFDDMTCGKKGGPTTSVSTTKTSTEGQRGLEMTVREKFDTGDDDKADTN